MKRESLRKVLAGVLTSVSILFGMAVQPVQAAGGTVTVSGGDAYVVDESGNIYTSSAYLEHLVRNFTATPGDASITLNWEFTGVDLSDGRVELYATTESVMDESLYPYPPDLKYGCDGMLPVNADGEYYVPVMIVGQGPQCYSYTYTGLTNGTAYYFVMSTNNEGDYTVYTATAVPGATAEEPSTEEPSTIGTMTVNGQSYELNYGEGWDSWTEAQQRAMDNYMNVLSAGIDCNTMSPEEMAAAEKKNIIGFIKAQTGIEAAGVPVWNDMDISLPVGVAETDIANGVEVTFKAPGIAAGDQLVVLHLKSDGAWEQIKATAGNGVITGTFTSLSPVFYAKIDTADAANDPADEANDTSDDADDTADDAAAPADSSTAAVTSPKTAENEMPAAVLAAAVMAVGASVCIRRRVNA